jgi:hypothetical protein
MSNTINPINYKEYPQCMFAMLAAFLPIEEGDDLRRAAGGVFFRSTDPDGSTYRNGRLHSYDDQPATTMNGVQLWFRNGVLHREGDLPAYVDEETQRWYRNGFLDRETGPAVVEDYGLGGIHEEWWLEGRRHRLGGPAFIINNVNEWWENGVFIRRELRR